MAKSNYKESIFMKNQLVKPFKEIDFFKDITFEDDIALFGIVDSTGNIFHYFLLVRLPAGYSILSSYGGDSVSIYQYETKVTPAFFENFVQSLKKKTKKPTDQKRIRGFMRAHFLNPVFQLVQRKSDEDRKTGSPMKNTPKDISDEIERYVTNDSRVIQFQSILSAIQDELSQRAEPAEEAEEPAEEAEEEAEAEDPIPYLTAAKQAEEDAMVEEEEELKRLETKGGTRRSKYKRRKYATYKRRRI
jgi:hypothetical protein